jgi:CHAD domain-containing protein
LKKSLYKYLKNRIEKIAIIIEKPRHNYNVETFHQLRVEIKKLHAAFALIKFGAVAFKLKKQFKPFQVIFKYAGKVRQIQIEQVVLLNYANKNELGIYRKNLRRKLLRSKNVFFNKIEMKLLIEKLNRIDLKTIPLNKIIKKEYLSFINEQKQKIKTIIRKKSLDDFQYHKLRKKLKQIYYVNQISKIKYEENGISLLTKQLGLWHDLSATRNQLLKSKKDMELNIWETKQAEKTVHGIELDIKKRILDINKTISKTKDYWNEKETLNLKFGTGVHQQEI